MSKIKYVYQNSVNVSEARFWELIDIAIEKQIDSKVKYLPPQSEEELFDLMDRENSRVQSEVGSDQGCYVYGHHFRVIKEDK